MQRSRGLVACLLLGLIGAGLSGYLFYLHLGLLRGELLGGPACGSGLLNCHAVTSGTWGSVLGMPLALWGLLGYVTVIGLSLAGRQSAEWAEHALSLITLLALLFLAIDLALLIVMVAVIRFYCVFCALTYLVNGLLLFIAWRSLKGPWSSALRRAGTAWGALWSWRRTPSAGLMWGFILMGLAGTAGLQAATLFVSQGPFGSVRRQLREFLAKQPRVTLDVQGDPMLGPPRAPLQIVEFSDFFCPACQRASQLNTIILAGHRRDAVFIFKHYPLDTSCNDRINRMVHPGACQVAAASECAHLQGTFWPFHDRLFAHGRSYQVERLEADAAQLGLDLPRFRACMASGEGLAAVKRDIAEGARVGVSSTPTYVINGVPATGGFNPAMFEAFVAALRETGG